MMEIIKNQNLNYDEYLVHQKRQSVATRQYPVYQGRCKRAVYECVKDWKSKGKVLEIGCGDGFSMDYIRKLKFRVAGIDINPEKIEVAKQHGHEAYCCDAIKLPFDDNSFHMVYCRHSLEHFLKPAEVLSEMNRVLRNRGVLSLITPIVTADKLTRKHVHAVPNKEYVKALLESERFTVIRNEERDMDGGREVWTLAKKNVILVFSSKRSISGLSRIVTLLRTGLNIDRICKYEAVLKVKNNYDYFFLHNVGNMIPELWSKSIIYGLQSIVNEICKRKELFKCFQKHPPLALLVNSESAKQELDKIGIQSTVIYRPNQLVIPDEYVKKTNARRVLWYINDSDPAFNQHHDIVVKTAEQLKDVEFLFFPDKKLFMNAANVKVLGEIKMYRYLNKVQGMVRISDKLDMGRAIFDVIASGRWVISWLTDEPFVHTVKDLSKLGDAIKHHLDNWTNENGKKLYNYVKENFNEKALQERWVGKVREVFEI